MNKIVLISGKQGSGKTTLAQNLMAALAPIPNVLPYHLTFAGPLYEMHDHCLEILNKYGVRRDIVKDGRLLQLLGTDWGRETLGGDIWVRLLKNKISRRSGIRQFSTNVFIVSDCRFRNEFDAFEDAFKIRLQAPHEIRKERCEQWRDSHAHISETDLDEYDQAGLFDVYYNTEKQKPGEIVEHLIKVLDLKNILA